MKVLHIISGADDGGAKIHLLNLFLGSKGLFENIIGCINKGSLYEEALKMGIKTIEFSQRSRIDLKIVEDISYFAEKNNIDIINFHGANANFIYMFLRKKTNIPCVTTLHSDYRYDFINNWIKYLIFTPINHLALKKFKNYIFVSLRLRKLMEDKSFRGNKFIVNNGINTDFDIYMCKNEIRYKYNIKEDDFVFVMVARFHPIKNHPGLIKAFSMLRNLKKDIKLLLVGDGDNRLEMETLVKNLGLENSVIFVGRQDNPIDYINASDINILTSFNETFPLVILEGALVKKAAICTDVGDISNIINKDTGYVINANSVEDIYEKMNMAYSKKEQLQIKGERLNEIVISEYTLKNFAEKYLKAYEEILMGDYNG